MVDGPYKRALNVVPLERKPWDEMVAYLEAMLDRAKRGELVALCVVGELADGDMFFQALHGARSYPIKMVGELEVAKWAVMHRHCAGLAPKGDA